MDSFSIIQQFFTQMQCHHCRNHFMPDGIELIREEEGVFLVSVFCHHCERQVGVAMVGVETPGEAAKGHRGYRTSNGRRYLDPELTPDEIERLSVFEPIREDDVLEAHHFIQNLGRDWMKFIPPEMRQLNTATETESPPS